MATLDYNVMLYMLYVPYSLVQKKNNFTKCSMTFLFLEVEWKLYSSKLIAAYEFLNVVLDCRIAQLSESLTPVIQVWRKIWLRKMIITFLIL